MSELPFQIELTLDEAVEARVSDEDLGLIAAAVRLVLQAEVGAQALEVTILISDDARLQALNQQFRAIDAPTDVLSFADDGPPAGFVSPPDQPRYLGDIAISLDRAIAQAAEYGHSLQRELAFLAAHGTLHLLGFDHERGPEDAAAMRAREEAAMQALGLPRE